jgi:hypothetical protein
MAIYRGAGGAGDATGDSASEALLVRELAAEVALDADAAEAARAAAVVAQLAAETAETNAETAETNAETAQTAAAASASSASSSASTATTQAGIATTQATNASNSATAAASSASSASTSATNAASSASAAATSATNANNSASSASTSATNAANSATSASTSATTATTQATNASNSATAASTSATNAANSATSASTSASTATTQAGIATTQATNASNSASAAATSATNAANSASAAATSATNAATSATNASNSATSAATSATNAANSFDAFDDRYLGNKASAPSLDNDGNALINGALYFDTTLNIMRVYSTTGGWQSITNALASEPIRHSVRPSLLLDFANTKTLDPRITFTRASTGTFYDGRTVAKAEQNLVTYSEQFDNAAWAKISSTVTANSTTAPDGTTTADTLTATASTNSHLTQQLSTTIASQTYTYSVFAKYNTAQYIAFGFTSGALPTGWGFVTVDIQNGTITQTTNGGGGSITASGTITSVGNGWYRITITGNYNQTNTYPTIQIVNTSTPSFTSYGAFSWTAVGTEAVFLWGAQAEARPSVTAYTATTTAPITNYIPALQTAASGVARFEHNPVTGESLGLEIEEQRTNLANYSEQFDNAYWTKSAVTISANQNIAPDGTLTSDQITSDGTSNVHDTNRNGLSSSGSSTLSIYAKKASARYLYLALNHTGNFDYSSVVFDLETGTAGTVVNAGNYTGGQASIVAVGNGWYRVSLSASHTTANDYVFIGISDSLNPSRVGRGRITSTVSGSLFLWGAQLEAGSFATSYIPTVASQVTRSRDDAVMTGTNFSSWYRADEGTLYAEWNQYQSGYGGTSTAPFAVTDASATTATGNKMYFYPFQVGNKIRYQIIRVNGTVESNVTSGTAVADNVFGKNAMAYKVNDIAFSSNGATVGTDTLSRIPEVDRAFIGTMLAGATPLNGNIKKIAYYPARISNAELQGLTTV